MILGVWVRGRNRGAIFIFILKFFKFQLAPTTPPFSKSASNKHILVGWERSPVQFSECHELFCKILSNVKENHCLSNPKHHHHHHHQSCPLSPTSRVVARKVLEIQVLYSNIGCWEVPVMWKHVVGQLQNQCRFYLPVCQFHGGRADLAPRSFFGVEDYLDDNNSRPYTYEKGKKSKDPDKHVSFKQRTVAYMEPYTLDVFISKRFVSASITHRVMSKQVAVAGTNSKDIKAVLKSRAETI